MSHYKPYPAYKDSGAEWIGKVPAHWDVIPLRHVASFKNSNVDKKAYEGQETVSLCNYTDVYYNEFITSDLPFMQATASAAEIEQFSLEKGDVLITKDSEDPSDIGIPSLVTEEMPGVVCGYHLTIIREDDFDTARLLHRILQSHPTQAHFFVEAPGITRYGLSQDAIGELRCCIPPKKERGQIADRLDRETARIDALITKKTEFFGLLAKKRQALITHAVTKGLDPKAKMKDSGVDWIGEVPEHWRVKAKKHVCELLKDGTHLPPARVAVGVPLLSVRNIQDGKFSLRVDDSMIAHEDFQELCRSFVPLENDVLLAIVGATIGKTAIVPKGMGSFHIQRSLAIFRPNSQMRSAYLHRLFESSTYQQQLWENAGFSAQPGIYLGTLANFRIPVPPIDEQDKVVKYLDRLIARIDLLAEKTQHSIDLLKERRSVLITAAVTGQIDLRESA